MGVSIGWRHLCLVILGAMACVRSPDAADRALAPLNRRAQAAAAQVAGCYALDLGPWREPDGTPLAAPRWDAPAFVPPPVVRLDADDSPVPVLGHFRLTPQPAADADFRYASWRTAADSLVLEWSGEQMLEPMYVIALSRRDSVWAGRASVRSDVVRERPYRAVTGRRVACPIREHGHAEVALIRAPCGAPRDPRLP